MRPGGSAGGRRAAVSVVTPAELAGHAFLRGLTGQQAASLASVATAIAVPAGHRFFDEGGQATQFWLIRTGQVALDLQVPGRPRLIVETLGRGDELGLSWLSESLEWQLGAAAQVPTTAFELDGPAVRGLCEQDCELGWELARRLLTVASGRLHAARIRLVDLYRGPDQESGSPR